jgi:hypothetical protein
MPTYNAALPKAAIALATPASNADTELLIRDPGADWYWTELSDGRYWDADAPSYQVMPVPFISETTYSVVARLTRYPSSVGIRPDYWIGYAVSPDGNKMIGIWSSPKPPDS